MPSKLERILTSLAEGTQLLGGFVTVTLQFVSIEQFEWQGGGAVHGRGSEIFVVTGGEDLATTFGHRQCVFPLR